jgi:alkylation response protein AidB-like acyl-CoA dehydrogenase
VTTDASLTEIADAAAALGELRDTARKVLARAWSPARFRELLDNDTPAFDDELWTTIRSLGWCDVLVSEDKGGGGASVAELCALAEECGAAAVPSPLGASAAAAWCEDECVEGTPLLLTAVGDGRSTISGTWPIVAYGAVATRLLVRTVADDGSSTIVAVDPAQDGVERTALRPLDHGPAAAVSLDNARVERTIAVGPEANARWATACRISLLAAVAELVGVAAAANASACEYAKVRVAFDRPIGTFQAIKHRLVDQRAAIEVARALVTRAADACDRSSPDAETLVSLAAFWAIDALRSVPEGAIQVFGGIGYTWEHEAHVHLRRAACLVASLGSRAEHRERVLQWLAARHSVEAARLAP